MSARIRVRSTSSATSRSTGSGHTHEIFRCLGRLGEGAPTNQLRANAFSGVRRLPVVEGDRLVGVLAQADVAQEAKAKQAGEVVEQISKPSGTKSP